MAAMPDFSMNCNCHSRLSSVERILAIVGLAEFDPDSLSAPDLSACSFGLFSEVLVSTRKIVIDRVLRRIDGGVIAIVNDRSWHAAEHRFDDVEKLRGFDRAGDRGKATIQVVVPSISKTSRLHPLRLRSKQGLSTHPFSWEREELRRSGLRWMSAPVQERRSAPGVTTARGG
jgi:hypothetical protein